MRNTWIRLLGAWVGLSVGAAACDSSDTKRMTAPTADAGGDLDAPMADARSVDAAPGDAPATNVSDANGDAAAPFATTFHIAMTSTGACAVFPDGRMKCWGNPAVGEMSPIGVAPGQMGAALAHVALPKRVRKVRAGLSGFCIVFEDGGLRCWGGGAPGQPNVLGLALDKITTNIDLGPGRSAIDVAIGSGHTCAALDNGSVKCWGGNSEGALGQGDVTDRPTPPVLPVSLGTGRTAKELTAGLQFTCALLDNGQVKCWGRNSNTANDLPTGGIGGVLASGGTAHIGNDPNEMGDNLPFAKLGTNPAEGAPWKVKKVAAGNVHACAILQNDRVKCWGRNVNPLRTA